MEPGTRSEARPGQDVPRKRLLWSGVLSCALVLAGWGNNLLVECINHVLHRPDPDVYGWWVYTMARLAVVAALLTVVLTGPRVSVRAGGARGTGSKTGFDPLLGLRSLACVLVVLGHFFLVVFPFPAGNHSPLLLAALRSCPWAGVWIFFTLSGFLMGKGFLSGRYALNDAGIRLFFRNRLLRLLPVYYVALALVCVLRYPALFRPGNLWMLLEIGTFDYRGVFPISPNPALWSISAEMQFYFLVPLLTLALRGLRRRWGVAFAAVPVLALLAGLLLRTLLLRWCFAHYGVLGYASLPPSLDLFVTGMALNLLPRGQARRPAVRSLLRWAMLAGGIAFAFGLSVLTLSYMQALGRFWVFFPLPSAVFATLFILAAEASGKIPFSRGLGGGLLKLVEWTGILTYCLYILHSDIMLANAAEFPVRAASLHASLLRFPPALLEVLAAALAMYFLVERPWDRRKQVTGTELTDAP